MFAAMPIRAQDPPEKRPVPEYDGRDEPTTAGDVLIWVPRILVSPLFGWAMKFFPLFKFGVGDA